MLHLLDQSLESYLRAAVPLADDVEVSFDTPDREWVSKLTQPTVDLFLYDVRPDGDSRHAGWETDRRPEGVWRRRPAPRASCRYLVTAWANDPGDEHHLLGAILALLLHPRRLPGEHLADGLGEVDGPPVLTVGFDDPHVNIADMWSALGGQLRPGVDLRVDLALEVVPAAVGPLGPPVVRAESATGRRDDGEEPDRRTRVGGRVGPAAPDARVRSSRGSALVRRSRFLVPAESGDRLFLDPEDRTVVVPDEGPADFVDPTDDSDGDGSDGDGSDEPDSEGVDAEGSGSGGDTDGDGDDS